MGANPHSETEWDADASSPDVPLPELEGYRIVREIGHGSMGHVYECHSAEFGTVAVKVLNFLAEGGGMAVERFRREVTVGARIGHPGIPTVYDSGRLLDGRFYLAMELLRGCDLEEWWDAPGHTRAEALDLVCQALEPLAAAHRHGVVHRDMKPENCFVEEDGTVRLLDFGVARSPDASQNMRTATGIAVGTPVYMSPEQATKPAEVDTPSDVWSAGVMLYEALSGELPFAGDSPHAVVLRACTEDPTPLGDRVPEVHADLLELVHLCLDKDPQKRPADAGALHAKLQPILARDEVRATLEGPAAAPSFRLSSSARPIALRETSQDTLPPAGGPASDTAPGLGRRAPRRAAWLALFALVAVVFAALWMASVGPIEEVSGAPEVTNAEPGGPAGDTHATNATDEADDGEAAPSPSTALPIGEPAPPTMAASPTAPGFASGDESDETTAEAVEQEQTNEASDGRRRRSPRRTPSRERAATEMNEEEPRVAEAPSEPRQPAPTPTVSGPPQRPANEPATALPPPTRPMAPVSPERNATTTVMTTRPRPQPMRPPRTEMRTERPGFVTF